MRRPQPWTSKDTRTLQRMHRWGFSARSVAIWLDRHRSVIDRQSRLLGLEFDERRIPWSGDEDETIRINYPRFPAFLIAHVLGRTPNTVSQRAARLGIEKAADFYTQPLARLWNSVDHPNSIASRIKPGSVPANKGLRRPGFSSGRMAETQFKKGRRPEDAHNYVPIGTEKVCPKRGLVRKVSDDQTVFPVHRWQPVHRLVWEAEHGPVPTGHLVRFRDGMKTFKADEITIDRLELVTMRENMARNTIHNYPPEIVSAMQMRGALTRAINRRERSTTR